MAAKYKVIFGGIVLAGVFLLGFLPQYSNLSRVRKELQAANDQITACEFRTRLCVIRDQAGFMYVETAEQNYGVAGEYSTPFFNNLRKLATETTDSNLKRSFEEMLARRDAVTAGLAKGDAAVLADIKALFFRVHESTKAY